MLNEYPLHHVGAGGPTGIGHAPVQAWASGATIANVGAGLSGSEAGSAPRVAELSGSGACSALPAAGLSSSGAGGWGGGSGQHARDMRDEEMEEAALLENVRAQQVMSVMRNPDIFRGLGLDEPPTSYTPGTDEEVWARVKVLHIGDDPQ